jgi:acetyl-CoA C-acetyltransferase
MSNKPIVYLCTPKRSAIGSFQGTLSSLAAPAIGSEVVRAIIAESKLDPDAVDQVIMGCVLTAGLGQAPARQVALRAGLPQKVQALTVNKVCSSGLKAVILAAQEILLGNAEIIVAGGIENMSQAPYLLPKLRAGARLGNVEAVDSITHDGLWEVYNNFHMGSCAELCAKRYEISREDQDRFTRLSYERALKSISEGVFKEEIVPIAIKSGKTESIFEVDEEPGKLKLEKLPDLKPVFEKDGTVTAANASSLSDGAAAMIVASAEAVKKYSLQPIARIVGANSHSQEPEWFTTAPVEAVKKLLAEEKEQIDLFEINEAFAAVALACGNLLNIPEERLNVGGGAVALGHPIGASGARILVTLLHHLKRLKLKRGVAAICNGGGEATALLLEAVTS